MLQADLLKPNQDPERISLNERLAKGIPLDDASWEQILAVGEALGLTHKTMHNLVKFKFTPFISFQHNSPLFLCK